jgi:anti-anti-sigma regulatory factor
LHFTGSEAFSAGARMTLRIQRSTHLSVVVFALSGRIEDEHVEELKRLFRLEPVNHKIVLNLKEVTLVDRDGVEFLARCKADGWELMDCPGYIREWMARG